MYYDICIIGSSSVFAQAFIKYLSLFHRDQKIILLSSKNLNAAGYQTCVLDYEQSNFPKIHVRRVVYDFSLLQNKRFYQNLSKMLDPGCVFVHISSNALLHKFKWYFKGDYYIRSKIRDRNLVLKYVKNRKIIFYCPNIIGHSDFNWQKFLDKINSFKTVEFGVEPDFLRKFMNINTLVEKLDPNDLLTIEPNMQLLEVMPTCKRPDVVSMNKYTLADKRYEYYNSAKKELLMRVVTSIFMPTGILKRIEKYVRNNHTGSSTDDSEATIVEGMTHAYLTKSVVFGTSIKELKPNCHDM